MKTDCFLKYKAPNFTSTYIVLADIVKMYEIVHKNTKSKYDLASLCFRYFEHDAFVCCPQNLYFLRQPHKRYQDTQLQRQ